jgi:Plasmid pRiA4b ORF-3-like protein
VVPGEAPIPDEREFRLDPLLQSEQAFEYVYDFGDHWTHDVSVKPILLAPPARKAECLDGQRAAPLEDCGGPDSYMDLLKAIAKPTVRSRELLEWAGPNFAPLKFDLSAVNRELRPVGTKAFLRKRERLYEGL